MPKIFPIIVTGAPTPPTQGLDVAAGPVKVTGNFARLTATTAEIRCGVSVSELLYTFGPFMASKDVWVPTTPGCPDDTNKDTQDLQCGVEQDTFFAFDLSVFPTGTITAATLDMQTTNLTVLTKLADSFPLLDADEGWNETTMTCSTRPATPQLPLQVMAFGTAAGAFTITLNSQWRARLNERIGVGTCTFVLRRRLDGDISTFESKDHATNPELGPRLTLTLRAGNI